MKRTLIVITLLFLSLSTPIAKTKTQKAADGKTDIPCPSAAELKKKGIKACKVTGCGHVDPELNKKKNIRTDTQTAQPMTIAELQGLADPVPNLAVGDPRTEPENLGEGHRITVVAYALIARKGGLESCNCKLSDPPNTDNHIVLVEKDTLALTAKATKAKPPAPGKKRGTPAKTAKQNTLTKRERQSTTAEFAPRVRLDHPKLAGARLQALIDAAPKNALLVRVTGLQFFDSEHSLGPFHLTRVNNWEIHPVMKLEFCPTGTCTADSNDGWKDLEKQP